MDEVIATLRFTQPALGASRRTQGSEIIWCMERAQGQQVMLLPTAWGHLMRYAAKVLNRNHSLVKKINWDPVIAEQPQGRFQRLVTPAEPGRRPYHVTHEAFLPGETIHVCAVLPDGLPREEFKELLRVAGAYKGMSPFHKSGATLYGTFEVVDVQSRYSGLQ